MFGTVREYATVLLHSYEIPQKEMSKFQLMVGRPRRMQSHVV